MGTPFVIGIAGGTGAGKTTMSRELSAALGGEDVVTRLSLDNYYESLSHLDPEERRAVNYDHPSAFEWDLLVDHLDGLRAGETVRTPEYDFAIDDRTGYTAVDPTEVVVVEGILALHEDRLCERMDLKVYVETDADVRILRRIRRDVLERGRDLDGVIDQYLSTVKPMHERYVAPTKAEADVVVPGGSNRRAVRLLVHRVRAAMAADREDDDAAVDSGVDSEADAAGVDTDAGADPDADREEADRAGRPPTCPPESPER